MAVNRSGVVTRFPEADRERLRDVAAAQDVDVQTFVRYWVYRGLDAVDKGKGVSRDRMLEADERAKRS